MSDNSSDNSEIIAVLLADGENGTEPLQQEATMLVRSTDGQMSLQSVDPSSTFGQFAIRSGYFRRSKPIIDPISRQMIGYEMEMVCREPLVAATSARFALAS